MSLCFHELEEYKSKEAAARMQVRLRAASCVCLSRRLTLSLAQLDRLSAQAQEAKRAANEGDQHRAQLQAQVHVRTATALVACDYGAFLFASSVDYGS
jgi:hypothetical protein